MAVDEGGTHREVLGHPYERVVHRSVAVGVELTQNLAHNTGALPTTHKTGGSVGVGGSVQNAGVCPSSEPLKMLAVAKLTS